MQVAYVWDFGDGNKSYEENPIHQYNSKGVYKVKLTAKNGSKSDVSEATVTITDPTKCYITGITYNKVGKENKYYRAVLKDDDLFTLIHGLVLIINCYLQQICLLTIILVVLF